MREIKKNEGYTVAQVDKQCHVDEYTHMTQKLPYLSGGLLHEKRSLVCFSKKINGFPILQHNKNRLISHCAEYSRKDQKI